MSVTLQTIYGVLDEKKLKDLKGAIDEVCNYYSEIERKQGIIKEIIDMAADESKIPKKIISKMAKVYHKQSFQTEVAENREFESLFGTIVELK